MLSSFTDPGTVNFLCTSSCTNTFKWWASLEMQMKWLNVPRSRGRKTAHKAFLKSNFYLNFLIYSGDYCPICKPLLNWNATKAFVYVNVTIHRCSSPKQVKHLRAKSVFLFCNIHPINHVTILTLILITTYFSRTRSEWVTLSLIETRIEGKNWAQIRM